MARKPHKCEAFQGKFLIGQKTITADSYVRDHQKFQKIYGSIADKILALKKEGDFLEIGAGGATLASIIAQKANNVSIVATDISADMVKLGRKAIKQKGLEKRIDYIHCKGEDINFPNKKFDAIYSSFSLNFDTIIPFDFNLSVLIGKEDVWTSDQIFKWNDYTNGICNFHFFQGGHFYLSNYGKEITHIISHCL